MQEDSASASLDQQQVPSPGSVGRGTEWAPAQSVLGDPTTIHSLQQQQQSAAAVGVPGIASPQPHLDHPFPMGHPRAQFHAHPPTFDPTSDSFDPSRLQQPASISNSSGAALRSGGDTHNSPAPGAFAPSHRPGGPAASPNVGRSSHGAGRQPPATPGHRGHATQQQQGRAKWIGHAGHEGLSAFQGPSLPPGPTPTSPSMPYAFMMPGSYPMQVSTFDCQML